MLATNLARVPALRVVSQSRLYEIGGQLGEPAITAAALAASARRAGAQELIEGELYATPAGGYRLDLRRIELSTGTVLVAHRVDGDDVFALVDDATSRIASDLGRSAGSLVLAEVTTQSIVAYRLYEKGLRTYYQGDLHRAQPLFRAAVGEDSLFALPVYYAIESERRLPMGSDTALEIRLLRLLERAPERERLLMRGRWATMTSDPALLAVAETLTIRYPAEPEGHQLLGHALVMNSQYARALPHLRRVIEMDSLGLRRTSPQCRACQAFETMVDAYYGLDSIAAAERVSREWLRLQPESAKPWIGLAHFLEYQGRTKEAQAARQKAAPYNPGDPYDHVFPAMLAIRTGDFAGADALLSEQARNAPPAVQTEALWFLVISLRYQGRLREALEEARRLRVRDTNNAAIALVEAQVLFEMGRYREAATLFRGIADTFPGGALNRTPSIRARHRAWWLTHSATAMAAAGDTARLTALADTIEAQGEQSLLGRDRKLHHHVRGLLLSARGRHHDAAEAFRRATEWPITPNSEYGRTNFELASALLRLDRAREAVRPLQLALTGPLETGNYYLSRSDLHALLGRVFDAAGQPDSAAVHYRWAIAAWRNADAPLHARRDSIRARLDAIEQNASRQR